MKYPKLFSNFEKAFTKKEVMKCKARSSFTLIELLVVVAILGILISILLPSLTRARKASETAVCISNQAQLFKSGMLYSQDRNGKVVPAGFDKFKYSFDDFLAPYMGRNLTTEELELERYHTEVPVLKCPSTIMVTAAHWFTGDPGFTRSYSMNTGWGWLGNNFSGITTEASGFSSFLGELNDPANLLYSGERHNTENAAGYGRSSGMAHMDNGVLGDPVHPGLRSTYTLVDGAVKPMKFAEARPKRDR
ncbi:MAG: prepilin-type N-terminal cleavage/methylation domain-containing protein [Lentisphaerales bacterium]|nr:prepilin-type N-terminal cleavage/methylation domain-containing protein [Lentisphaerales bacterium]